MGRATPLRGADLRSGHYFDARRFREQEQRRKLHRKLLSRGRLRPVLKAAAPRSSPSNPRAAQQSLCRLRNVVRSCLNVRKYAQTTSSLWSGSCALSGFRHLRSRADSDGTMMRQSLTPAGLLLDLTALDAILKWILFRKLPRALEFARTRARLSASTTRHSPIYDNGRGW